MATDAMGGGADDHFEEPTVGAAVCYLVEDTMDEQLRAWRERSTW